MTNTVNNRQLVILLVLIIPSNVMGLAHNLAKVSLRGGWIPIIIGTIVFGIVAAIIFKLNNMYLNKTIVEYSKEILGKVLSNILLIFLIIYFIIFFVFVCEYYFGFIKTEFLFKTPEIVLLITGIAAFGFIVNKGITPITRAAEIIIPFYIIFTVTFYIVGIFQSYKYNLLPIFSKDEISQYFSGITETIVPFIGAEMLLIVPFSKDNKKSPKLALFTLILIGAYYILVFFSSIGVLGINSVQINEFSGFETLKNIEIPVIERVDILYETFGFATMFFKLSFYYLVVVEFICRMLPSKKRWIIVTITGMFLTILVILSSIFNLLDFLDLVLKILGIVAALIIPIVLFIIAKVKNKNAKKQAKDNGQETA